MEPVVRESALWGVTSGLLFVVLAFGYRLATDADLSVLLALVVGCLVGTITAGLSYLVDRRFP
ncbi:hypothetical protein [Halosegnis longus]|uniref:DUF7981 domain-containing protein n=1 Tax=Halosegnis longus TaxID=2216012 RepID=A0AAJ4R6K3_9EURY|nr:hypothetical protein [Salella cibi]RNJ25363.1 hypothetical protein Nmn1133_00720 [Salella cibi]